MTDRTGICGGAMFQSLQATEYSTDELVYATVKRALQVASLTVGDIDFVVQNADDALEGIAIQHVYQVEAAGSFLKQETKLEGEPGRAVAYGLHRLKAGLSQCVLIVAYGKASQVDTAALELMGTDPFFQRPVEATVTALAGLQASEFLKRTGLTESHLCRSRAIRHGVAVDVVEKSAPVALPLRKGMLPQYGDLCVALLLSTGNFARKKALPFTAVSGVGLATAAFPFSEFAFWHTAEKAIQDAMQSFTARPEESTEEKASGGVATKDAKALFRGRTFLEFVDGWAHQEWMLAESLGLLDTSDPDSYLNDGRINTTGPCVYSPPATGAARILAAHELLTKEAAKGNEADALVISSAGLASVSSFHLSNRSQTTSLPSSTSYTGAEK